MEMHETDTFTMQRAVEDGIERVVYLPKQRKFETPIVFQHGMWHGAWCWQWWQELFAEWGWESHAHSLPGHAGSPTRRPLYFCTLGYYLRFLKAEVQRQPVRPVLIGHSMGGALTQRYLRYCTDDLPAAVLLASWSCINNQADGGLAHLWKTDAAGVVMMFLTGSAQPLVRSPERAAKLLISPGDVYSPEAFRAHLTPESFWVMAQHNLPFWTPPPKPTTPLLVVAAEKDATISVAAQRHSAAHYGAECVVIPDAAHNLMMEHNRCDTARMVHEWLIRKGVR